MCASSFFLLSFYFYFQRTVFLCFFFHAGDFGFSKLLFFVGLPKQTIYRLSFFMFLFEHFPIMHLVAYTHKKKKKNLYGICFFLCSVFLLLSSCLTRVALRDVPMPCFPLFFFLFSFVHRPGKEKTTPLFFFICSVKDKKDHAGFTTAKIFFSVSDMTL
jgi:hypothetical protein